MKCVISLYTAQDSSVDLTGVCEAKDKNNEKFWAKLRRSSSGVDAGVGKMTFIIGTSKYTKLKNITAKIEYSKTIATDKIMRNK